MDFTDVVPHALDVILWLIGAVRVAGIVDRWGARLLKRILERSDEKLRTASRNIWSDAEVDKMVEDGVIRGWHKACSHPPCVGLRMRYYERATGDRK